MTKINKVIFENFKNKEGEQNLDGYDVFIGSNGVGKSSIIQAINLALTGEINGKSQPKDKFKFANKGDKYTVGINAGNLSVLRSIERHESKSRKTGEISIKYNEKLRVSACTSTGIKENQKKLDELIGTLSVGFDFKKFSGLTDSEKRNYILSFCNSSYELDKAIEFLKKKYDETLNKEKYNEIIEKAVKEAGEEQDIQKKVDMMLSYVKEQYSFTRKEIERSAATIQKLTDKKNNYQIADKGLKLDKAKAEKLNEKIIEKEKELATIKKTNEIAEKNLKAIEEIKKAIEEAQTKKCELNIEELQEKKNNYITQSDTINKKNVENSQKINTLNKQFEETNLQIENERKKVDQLKEKGIELKTKYHTSLDLLNRVKNIKGKCAINPNIPCNANFVEWLKKETAEINSLAKELKNVVSGYNKEKANLDSKIADLKKIQEQKDNIINEQQKNIKNIEVLNNNINVYTKKIENVKNFDSLKKQKIEQLTAEMNKLIATENKIIDYTNIEPEIEKLKAELKELKEVITQKEQLVVLTSQVKEAQLEYDNIEAENNIYKSLVKNIRKLQNVILQELLNPIISEINQNLETLSINRKFTINTVNEQENDVFDFGLDGINFNALSTGQQAILSIAMVIAFISKSNSTLKILCVDNAENLDTDNLGKLLKGLESIYENGKLDNIIICGCLSEVPEGKYTVNKLQ